MKTEIIYIVEHLYNRRGVLKWEKTHEFLNETDARHAAQTALGKNIVKVVTSECMFVNGGLQWDAQNSLPF